MKKQFSLHFAFMKYFECSPEQFFAVNRFFYDLLTQSNKQQSSLKSLAEALCISYSTLRNNLQRAKLPVRFSSVVSIAKTVKLPFDPPQIYNLIHNAMNSGTSIDSIFIEHFQPVAPYHFDFIGLLQKHSECINIPSFDDFDTEDINYQNCFYWKGANQIKREIDHFNSEMKAMFDNLPEFMKSLDGDQRFLINSNLSMAFLYGNVEISRGGIGSPHLKGVFSMSARKEGTGYLNLDSILNSNQKPDIEKFQQVLNWIKGHNPLYKEIKPLKLNFYRTKIDPLISPKKDVIGIAQIPDNQANPNNVDFNKVPISIPDENGNNEKIYVEIEKALLLCFPMIFPNGTMPIIPGRTLREKASILFASHEFYRCGRLQCSMILFLYSQIMAKKASYINNKISAQRVMVPNGTSRIIPNINSFKSDPAFPEYWYHKQSHVRAMCAQLGDPDLMVTFTFVNNWPEVRKVEEKINALKYDKMDIRFCPFEEMLIWKRRFDEIRKNRFNDLINNMGFGEVSDYCWRLEFQARGAPHVHALIWLKNRMTLDQISKKFYASLPPLSANRLLNLVSTTMIHKCTLSRCKKGIETASCRYGYPKSPCDNIHIDTNGNLVLPRNDNETRVVEYSPYFLLKWGGHCHVHILRNSEHTECSANAIHYIVKYNFKSEPSLRVQVSEENQTSYATAFHARIVSVEEAVTKIISLDYFESSVASMYLSLKPPENRQAAFRDGEQMQITLIDKYFRRPKSLERIGILNFFSFYEIKATKYSNLELIQKFGGSSSQRIDFNIPPRPERPPNTLKQDSNWDEQFNRLCLIDSGFLFPDENLPNAKALKINKRMKPKIILTERFTVNSNIEDFCYLFILLNGSWRSDNEMKAHKESWQQALEYHGLAVSVEDNIYQYYQTLIMYMLNSPQYNMHNFVKNITMMNYDMIPFLNQLKQKVSNANKDAINEAINELKNIQDIRAHGINDVNDDLSNDVINNYVNYSWNDEEIANAQSLISNIEEKLNHDQKCIYREIKDRLIAGQQVTAFVKGKAGTGKSFLIKSMINFLIANKIPYVTCASTGIAASLINGKTVHSAFSIYTARNYGEDNVFCSLDICKPNGFAMTYAKVVIIDEVTMISAKVLTSMEYGLRKIMSQKRSPLGLYPFGGKSILLFGDLAQVPAVTRAPDDFLESLQQFNESEIFTGFVQYELKTVMRQLPDEVLFIKLLDYIRNHRDGERLDPEIENALKQQFVSGKMDSNITNIDFFVGGDSPNGMVITFTNKEAQLYNKLILESRTKMYNCPIINISAKFYVRKQNYYVGNRNQMANDEFRRQLSVTDIRVASEDEVKIFCGAMKKRYFNSIIPFNLEIAKGSRVMLLQNLNVNLGFINGARGTVYNYIQEVDAIEVFFDHQKPSEKPILVTRTKSMEYQINNGKVIFMYQFPLKLAWAVTAHKSQGQTLEKCAIHIGEKAFAHGSLYVALSRVKSIKNIRLFGLEFWPDGGPFFHVNPFIQSKQNEQAVNEFE